jgi:hypothetical protein
MEVEGRLVAVVAEVDNVVAGKGEEPAVEEHEFAEVDMANHWVTQLDAELDPVGGDLAAAQEVVVHTVDLAVVVVEERVKLHVPVVHHSARDEKQIALSQLTQVAKELHLAKLD